MPFAVAFLGAIVLALWVMYDAGQVDIGKMRLQNTADSAAYSTATMMARNYNYVAYTNRAMVANQVAIGQLVGLASWLSYEQRVRANIGRLGPAAASGVAAAPAMQNLMQAFQAAYPNASAANGLLAGMVGINDAVIIALSRSQLAFHEGAVVAALQMSSDVTKANVTPPGEPDHGPYVRQVTQFVGDTGPAVAQAFIGLQQQLRPLVGAPLNDEARVRFAQFQNVVLLSRDHFSARRSYVWPPPYSRYRFGNNRPVLKFGGSELIQDPRADANGRIQYDWTAMDDVSPWTETCTAGSRPRCTWQEGTPIGWGAAHALSSGANNPFNYGAYARRKRLWGGGAWVNAKAAAAAATDDGSNEVGQLHYGGLQPFFDLRDSGRIDDGPAILVTVTEAEQGLQTQKAISENSNGSFHVYPEVNDEAEGKLVNGHISALANAQITVLAKAQIYFYRPYEENPSTDPGAPDWNRQPLASWIRRGRLGQVLKYEHGNVYNPFWEVHLVDTSDQERQAAVQLATSQ